VCIFLSISFASFLIFNRLIFHELFLHRQMSTWKGFAEEEKKTHLPDLHHWIQGGAISAKISQRRKRGRTNSVKLLKFVLRSHLHSSQLIFLVPK
jgi:hypothetical protein